MALGRGPIGVWTRSRAAWYLPSKWLAAAHQRHDDLQCLLPARAHGILGQPEHVRLLVAVAGAKSEDEAAAADLVESLRCLGDDPGIAVQRREHPRTDLDLRRDRGGGAT